MSNLVKQKKIGLWDLVLFPGCGQRTGVSFAKAFVLISQRRVKCCLSLAPSPFWEEEAISVFTKG